MVVELSLIVLRCTDLDRSKAFYAVLGCDFVSEKHGRGPSHYSCRIGSAVLELYPAAGKSTVEVRIGFAVRDLSRILARLPECGGSVKSRASDHALVLDPDGHKVELTILETATPKPSSTSQ